MEMQAKEPSPHIWLCPVTFLPGFVEVMILDDNARNVSGEGVQAVGLELTLFT